MPVTHRLRTVVKSIRYLFQKCLFHSSCNNSVVTCDGRMHLLLITETLDVFSAVITATAVHFPHHPIIPSSIINHGRGWKLLRATKHPTTQLRHLSILQAQTRLILYGRSGRHQPHPSRLRPRPPLRHHRTSPTFRNGCRPTQHLRMARRLHARNMSRV